MVVVLFGFLMVATAIEPRFLWPTLMPPWTAIVLAMVLALATIQDALVIALLVKRLWGW
jgi:hypothetical protein